jgi:hypothetical protein
MEMGLPIAGSDVLQAEEKDRLQKLGVFSDDADEAVQSQPSILHAFRVSVRQNEDRAYEELKAAILRVNYHGDSSSDDDDGGQDEDGPELVTS